MSQKISLSIVVASLINFSGCGGSNSQIAKNKFIENQDENRITKNKLIKNQDENQITKNEFMENQDENQITKNKFIKNQDENQITKNEFIENQDENQITKNKFIKNQDENRITKNDRENAFFEYSQKPNLKSAGFSNKPFEALSNRTQEHINYFIKYNPNAISEVPKEIATPELPAVEKLQQGRFEKTVEFRERVQKVVDTRESKIRDIQEEYRKKVENRNEIIKILQSVNNKEFIAKIVPIATQYAISDIFGEFGIIPKDYNPDSEILLADIKSKNSTYSKSVTFKISPKNAEEIYNNKDSFLPKVNFEIINSTISLQNISLNEHIASFDNSFKKAEKIEVSINNSSVNFSGIDKQLTIQSANLKDYKIDKSQFIDSEYNDDLPNILTSSPKAQTDYTKWAFIIGVEKYRDTDSVPYSKRSSEMFKQVVSHSLGVPERNIYLLVDTDATTTAIKDSLKRMKENIKTGDTIYFYYSGHGVPNANGKAYILPQDKFVDYVADDKALQLDEIYKNLTDSKANKVIAFVDSCFSGRTGAETDETLFKGKGVAGIYARDISTEFDKKRMAVITAGGKNEFSNMFDKRGHRMFSYYLMKDILSGEKNIEAIHNRVQRNVLDESSKKGDRYRQTPEIDGNKNLNL